MGKHSSSWARIDASRRARWLAPALILGLVAIVLLLIWINTRSNLEPWQ